MKGNGERTLKNKIVAAPLFFLFVTLMLPSCYSLLKTLSSVIAHQSRDLHVNDVLTMNVRR